MNTQLLKSIAWKEYRVLRPIWLSMLAITIAMQLLVLVSLGLSQKSVPMEGDPLTWWLFSVALAMCAMYALGCTAALFSAEREEGTYEFLKLRAVPPRKLVAQKAGLGLLSTALLLFVVWFTAFTFAGRLPSPEAQEALWYIIGLSIPEVFAWGTLFSLLLKQPLRAAVLAITAATATVQLIPFATRSPFTERLFFSHYMNVVPERLFVLVVLIAINIWLAGRWFDRPWFATSLSHGVRSRVRNRRLGLVGQSQLSARAVMFGRLAWQQWHQTKGTTFAIGAGAILLMVLLASDTQDITGLPWPFSLLCAALIGTSVYLPDKQQHGNRFMVTHAVPPTLIWLSRQFVGLASSILMSGILLAITAAVALTGVFVTNARTTDVDPYSLFQGICGILLVFATGQLCSLLFRGALLSVFFGLAFAAMLIGWALLMDAIDAAWWWSVAPLPVAFWLATWLRTPSWLLERKDWRSWLPVALTICIPTIVILIAVPCFRVYQIPFRDPGFSVSEFAPPITPEERTTADMYRRAGELIEPMPRSGDGETEVSDLWQPAQLTPEEIMWVENNQPAIELALEASNREACVFDDPNSGPLDQVSFDRGYELADLLAYSARVLQADGKLDEAFDRYLAILRLANHCRNRGRRYMWWGANSIEREAYWNLPGWAAAEGQTPNRIRNAISEVQLVVSAASSAADAFKTEHILMNRLLTADTETLGNLQLNERDQRSLIFLMYLSPWELVRTQRLLNLLTSEALVALESANQAKLDDPRTKETHHTRYWKKYQPWMRSTLLSHIVLPVDPESLIIQPKGYTAIRHAAIIQMALAGWYHEHGALPQNLDELVGPYFEEMPLDPYTGKPFHYRPEGFATPVRFDSPNKPIPADWPLIWSPGSDQAQLAQVGTDENGNAIYEIQGTAEGYIQEPTQHSHFGLAFPLPALPSAEEP